MALGSRVGLKLRDSVGPRDQLNDLRPRRFIGQIEGDYVVNLGLVVHKSLRLRLGILSRTARHNEIGRSSVQNIGPKPPSYVYDIVCRCFDRITSRG